MAPSRKAKLALALGWTCFAMTHGQILGPMRLHNKNKDAWTEESGLSLFGQPSVKSKKTYVVLMKQDPTVNYALSQGEESGLFSSGSSTGESTKIMFNDTDLQGYADNLKKDHVLTASAAGIPSSDIVHEYVYAGNGFAAKMTDAQAEQLKTMDGVAAVFNDVIRQKATDTSIEFLGLGKQPLSANSCRSLSFDGEGVVVGIIDTGCWPEHPSFADDGTFPKAPELDEDVRSSCDFGNKDHNPNDAEFQCNNKLVGGRTFLDAYKVAAGLEEDEFDSCRDHDGHGSHTAGTTAGNANVEVQKDGLPSVKISGVAPRARIICYKALAKKGGFSSDLAGAIDQATADGVDVINYSIGGGAGEVGLDEIMFLNAANAGVFVAASAGNSGPGPTTVGNPATVPWVTTVGASTENQCFRAKAIFPTFEIAGTSAFDHPAKGFQVPASDAESADEPEGPGASGKQGKKRTLRKQDSSEDNLETRFLKGGGGKKDPALKLCSDSDVDETDARAYDTEEIFISAPLLDAEFAGDELCKNGTLNEEIVRGTIVLCLRGEVARVEKSAEVARAGGVGMIMYNVDDTSSLNADLHSVQSIHIDNTPGLKIKEYITNSDENNPAVGAISADYVGKCKAPNMASFSSRGPNYFPSILKPDITAPGVSILAADTPMPCCGGKQGSLFQSISGTSMSGPHIAGIFALLKQARKKWSPAMAKSAVMTSSHQDVGRRDGKITNPFDYGAGHVSQAVRWLDPGLVYDLGFNDYQGWICAVQPDYFTEGSCADKFPIDYGVPVAAKDLNYPTIAVEGFATSATATRTVRSVAIGKKESITYTVTVDPPEGYIVEVDPSQLTLAPGDSASYTVTVTPENASMDDWSHGSLTWADEDGRYSVYSPIVALAEPMIIPDALSLATGASGAVSYDVEFGISGDLFVDVYGLEPAELFTSLIVEDTQVLYNFTVAPGTAHLRISCTISDGETDLDLEVYNPEGELVKGSYNSGTEELVDIKTPVEGDWTVLVDGYAVPADSQLFDLYTWAIPDEPNTGYLSVQSAPERVKSGTTETITLEWDGLPTSNDWYIGYVTHSSTSIAEASTMYVEVDNR